MFSCEAVTELDLDTLESSENIEFEIFCTFAASAPVKSTQL